MKYRLKRDLPDLKAGTVFERDSDGVWTAIVNGGHPNGQDREYTFCDTYMFNRDIWFEPLSPQEEVEELTEDDFDYGGTKMNGYQFTDGYLLTEKGRDKLIRIINRCGKGNRL